MDAALHTCIEHLRDSAAERRPLRIVGGDSKHFYGQALHGELLSTRDLQGIVSYEPSELVVTVRAGTRLVELEATLAEKGQGLAFEPPHFGPDATVGGMVSAGLSGPARASVGGVRDYVLGAHLLNGRAELLQFGGQVMKNVAGYDVSRLLVGAMGTLGLITQVSLKVLPRAPAQATVCFEMEQAQALRQLHLWGGQPLPLNASNWVCDGGRPLLFVRWSGAVAAVEAACRQLGGERLDNARVAADWRASAELTLPFFTEPPRPDACLWRLSVPQTTPVLDLPEPVLVEWQGAVRWLWAPADRALALRELARQHGGHATLFKAARPADKAVGVFTPTDPVRQRIQQAMKREFDPLGLFNPGRLDPEL